MAENNKQTYFDKSADKVMEMLSAKEDGLSEDEIKKRQEKYGKNELPGKKGTNPIKLFLKQFKDFLVLILVIAAGIAFWADKMTDVYVIIGVIIINAIIGFVQEYRAEKAILSLKKMVSTKTTVRRDGEQKSISATEIVPGDILVLQEGDSVPADARIIKFKNLTTVEASLTGESMPIDKDTEPVDEETPLADRTNMIYKGTHISRGSVTAVVTATAKQTEIGKIAKALSEVKTTDSNFKKKTARLGKVMAGVAIASSIIVFALGYFLRDFDFQNILLVTIAVLVSSIPEGLPAVISIVLAIGANRMAKRNAIIREFTATEMLGSVSVILTDKTGTITQSVLTVKNIFTAGEETEVGGEGHQLDGDFSQDEEKVEPKDKPALQKILAIARHCNQASIEENGKDENENEEEDEEEDENGDENGDEKVQVSGDPTEQALLVLARKEKNGNGYEVLDDLPFNSEQKFRASLVEKEGKKELFVVGAPEVLLEKSDKILQEDGAEEFNDDRMKKVKEQIEAWTDNAMRVIALAYKEDVDADQADADMVEHLVFAGIVGLTDPPRPEIKGAVEECRRAGIRVVMVTGDHKKTAAAIAREVGIIREDEKKGDFPLSMEGKELNELSDEDFDKAVEKVNVFARVDPETKLKIAEHLQEKGHLVGMTGDGVNDAPALKRADVGIAMGQKGTDVAKDAAQIVLSDDNFASIVAAVHEGRIVFQNLRQTSFFLVTTNFASASVLITGIALGYPIPLLATQILWINLVTDGIMDISLATEPGHGDMMNRKPIDKKERILNRQILPYLLIIVPVMVSLAILAFGHYLPGGVEKARTAAFIANAMTQIFNAFNMRSLNHSAFEIGIFGNKWVNIAFVASIILQFGAVSLPFMQDLLHFSPIGTLDFIVITLLASSVFWLGELYKLIRRKSGK
ncbi:MAG: cation-translocating P-type ATPase [Bacteroidales bacterium]